MELLSSAEQSPREIMAPDAVNPQWLMVNVVFMEVKAQDLDRNRVEDAAARVIFGMGHILKKL